MVLQTIDVNETETATREQQIHLKQEVLLITKVFCQTINILVLTYEVIEFLIIISIAM